MQNQRAHREIGGLVEGIGPDKDQVEVARRYLQGRGGVEPSVGGPVPILRRAGI
jgi:hypothetical protein